jgi:hypothetical protein
MTKPPSPTHADFIHASGNLLVVVIKYVMDFPGLLQEVVSEK